MTLTIRSVELPDGVRLQYAEQGDPAGLPVILLHGVTDSWRSFAPVLPHLPAWIRALALTQRGHGDSDRPVAGYRTRDLAADVAAFADALGIGQALIVGHSMGASNAQRFAIDHPERVLGLVLAAAFASYDDNPAALEFWESAVAPLRDPIDPAFVRAFQESTLARPVPPAFLDAVVGESLKLPARVWQALFAGFIGDDCKRELTRITAPALVIWGDRDGFCRRSDQDTLVAAIAGSRLLVYEGAGHALHWEEPERFAADLVAFAERLGAGRG